jgi:hypothetical protein
MPDEAVHVRKAKQASDEVVAAQPVAAFVMANA